MSTIQEMLLQEAANDLSILNEMTENSVNTNSLKSVTESLETSPFQIPYSIDAIHIVNVNNKNYIVHMEEVQKLQKISGSTINETLADIAEFYEIDESSIIVDVSEFDDTDSDVTLARLNEANENKISVKTTSYWQNMIVSDTIDEDADMYDGNITDIEQLDETADYNGAVSFDPEIVAFTADMVNVYTEGSDAYVEMSELNRFMNDQDISSVKEAVETIAEANEIQATDITILCEKCCGKKCSAGKKKSIAEKYFGDKKCDECTKPMGEAAKDNGVCESIKDGVKKKMKAAMGKISKAKIGSKTCKSSK